MPETTQVDSSASDHESPSDVASACYSRREWGETKLHRAAIDRLKAAGALEGGFGVAVHAATAVAVARMEPDAFQIDPAAQVVDMFEVEVWHAIDKRKAAKIRTLHEDLARRGWTLRLFVVDRRHAMTELNPATMTLSAAELEKTRALMDAMPGFSSPPLSASPSTPAPSPPQITATDRDQP